MIATRMHIQLVIFQRSHFSGVSRQVLIDWINDVLAGERIIVKDLAEDLYDGQVLQKLFGEESVLEKRLYCCSIKTEYWIVYLFPEELEGEKLNVAEMTQCEIAQKQKLQTVLEKINDTLKVSSRNIKWNVDCMYFSFGLFSL